MSNHNSGSGTEESRTQLYERTHAEATITVHNSKAKPFDPPAKPALMEITLSKYSSEILMESHRFGRCKYYATITLPA